MTSPSDSSPSAVQIGTRVEVELVGKDGTTEHLAFDLVPESAADFSSGFLGAGTPLAQAILGQRAGSLIPYRLADIVAVRILSVARSERRPPEDAATERDALLRGAVNRSNLEDAVRLALTVDVKWGDYDPDGIRGELD